MSQQGSRFFSIDDLTHMPRPTWLIDNLLGSRSIAMLAGPPGCYKSFMARDWMLSMATGRDWAGRAVRCAKSLYILGEGRENLLKRLQVWRGYNNLSSGEEELLSRNFRVTFDMPQMTQKPSVDNLLSSLNEIGFNPDVIVIDTLSRSAVGMDENSQKDMGMWIEQAERLRDLGMTVIIVHHTAKNTEFGHKFRGSSVILGAVDTAILQISQENRVVLKVEKQKDADQGKGMNFNRLIIKQNNDDDGSIILQPTMLVDERFDPNYKSIIDMAIKLIGDDTFKTDSERAEILSNEYGLSMNAAKVKLSRVKRGES